MNKLNITSYEVYVILCILISATFLIISSNLKLQLVDKPDLYQTANTVFIVSLVSIVIGFLSLLLYNILNQPVDITNTPNSKKILVSLLILIGIWFFNYYITHVEIYRIGIFSTISANKLVMILGTLSAIFSVVLAVLENSLFAVTLPSLLLVILFRKQPKNADIFAILLVSILSGALASIWHIGWQEPIQLLTTFICFTAWSFVTLYTQNPIFADAMHVIGNAFGILYMVVNPYMIANYF